MSALQPSLAQLRQVLQHIDARDTDPTETTQALMYNPDYDTPVNTPPLVLRSAAVLIIACDTSAPDDEQTTGEVLLTVRHTDLPQHPGQVALPGGTQEAADRSLLDTAKRETQEEIGLCPNLLEHPQQLPDFIALSGFRITPFVALAALPNLAALQPNPAEVSAVFSVPLGHCLNPNAYQLTRGFHEHQPRAFYELPNTPHRVWGVTAGILWGFQHWFWQAHQQLNA